MTVWPENPYATLTGTLDARVLTLTLNRPAQLNSFTVTMAHELIDAFGRASEDDSVGAIVVTGAGRAFCAGMDLTREGNAFGLDTSLQPTLEDLRARFDDPPIVAGVRDTGGRVTLAIYDCKKPVIAAINGAAVGSGATRTLAMDMRIAFEQARFGFVFGKIGITPEAHRIESLAVFYASQRDGKEGVRAFLEKRAPKFSDKCSDGMPPFYPWW